MNVADCSVGNNPLMQLNKQTQNDNLLMQNLSPGNVNSKFRSENISQQFKSHVRGANEDHKQYINDFMNRNSLNDNIINGDSSLDYLKNRETYMDPSGGQSNFSNQINNNVMKGVRDSEWANDFRNGKQNIQQFNNNNDMQHLQSGISHPLSASLNIQNRMMPMMATDGLMKRSLNRNINGQNLMDKNDWDERFKELEKEVSENLNINDDEIESEAVIETEMNDMNEEVVEEKYKNAFQEAWDSISKDAEDLLPDGLNPDAWETEHQHYFHSKLNQTGDYSFAKTNEFLHNPNAYEIGCMLMENGAKLSEAALSFEAALQDDPSHVDAWLKLGLVQIQNEKEIHGISALEKCLQLDPKNLDAMKNLAISYINEGFDVSAFTMLNRWIETKYSSLLNSDDGIEMAFDQNRYKLNEIVTKQFLNIANKLPNADADVQLGLGLLFYSNNEFDKTIDCFKTALVIHPEDELMWNRLGASLANSSRPEEAIQAYHKALQLKPSFVRARYNLAVSSINIGCYKEAAEHLLTSLRMHEVDGVNNQISSLFNDSSSGGNENILQTLKRTFIAMGRQDLLEHVYPGMKLDYFHNEFTF
ncbi:hypothetical protein TPHA_0L01210 [Tetrapisispora phaffii CBS 4417]|uniref:Uncharacterized protein n=1 Tax=Tetrapisispora phaffii (strain ATCC 24235 / CBS 4417 / NBRC 1672 / NRRL Y-8282 / UCD 70-5) TaxID=1071381 RepID=G8C000_TETPH|nr:hypothetical protein TPHA_0L01210 [Tetrapisispora phaffii CBS 4417]CCE65478.1 hypothetical protein TPHA_0L01210 [Tetrapisispora phaffii CBS 4417]